MSEIESEILDRARKLLEERDTLVRRLGEVNRALADCSAAARLFSVTVVDLPSLPITRNGSFKVCDVVADKLREAKHGITASEINQHLRDLGFGDLHKKTVGMYLYRQMKKGLAERNGHVWKPVAPDCQAGVAV